MLDIGSFDGSDSLPSHRNGYTVYAFEPKEDLYMNLVHKTRGLDRYHVIKKAVSLVDGDVDFNICVAGGASSILPFKSDDDLNTHWTSVRQDIHFANQSYRVNSTRLDTFLEEYNLTTVDIDYIHIDAQGVDLDVLKSLGKYIRNVKSGVLETCYSLEKAIYSTQKDTVKDVQLWLIQNNFVIDKVVPNDNTMCECNVYFHSI